jgi:hypothetical protein
MRRCKYCLKHCDLAARFWHSKEFCSDLCARAHSSEQREEERKVPFKAWPAVVSAAHLN